MPSREKVDPALRNIRRSVARRIAGAYFLFAAAWIAVSDLALLKLTKDLPAFAGASLVKGGVFVLVTTALLYLYISHQLGADTAAGAIAADAATPPRPRRNPAVVFAGAAALVIVLALAMFSYESGQQRELARTDMAAILELKASQIEQWLEETGGMARSYGRARGLREDMALLGKKNDPELVSRMTQRIQELRNDLTMDAVLVLDKAGLMVATAGRDDLRRLSPAFSAQAARSMESGKPVPGFIHRDTNIPNAPVMIDFIAPLLGEPGTSGSVGALVFREDARQRFFPLVQNWPIRSSSAESLLVRREGDEVLFLTDLRYAKDAAFRFRRPLGDPELPAAKAIMSETPVLVEGKDYRGVDVVAAGQRIAGTDWFLIAKIDREEVLAPVRRSSLIWLGSILCMTLLSAAGIAIMWRQQVRLVATNERIEAAGRRRAESKLSAAEERYRALFERSLDCIFLSDLEGNFLDANRTALDLLGYRREEISSLNYGTVLDSADLPRALETLKEVVRTGSQLEAHEYGLRRKDGGRVVVESKTVLVYADDQPSAILGIARDVTERKRQQARITRLTQIRDCLSAVNRAIVHADSEESLFAVICDIATKQGQFVAAWIGEPDAASGNVLVRTSAGTPAGLEYVRGIRVSQRDEPEGRGPTGLAIREDRTVVMNDYHEYADDVPWHRQARAAGIRSGAALPLRRLGATVAALSVYSDEPGYFDGEIVALLEEMAGDVSFSLDVIAGEMERRRVQQDLEYKSRMLATQQEVSPDAILVVGDNSRIVSYNHRFLEMWNIPDDMARTGDDEPVLHAVAGQVQNVDKFINKIKYLYENRTRLSHDEVHLRDGRILDRHSAPVIGANNVYYGRVWFFRDITERKRAELELRESEQRFRVMIEQSISGFYMIEDGRFSYVNARFAHIFGYADSDEIIGKNPAELVAERDRATVAANIRRRLSGEAKSISYSFIGLRKDGTEIEVGVHGSYSVYGGRPVIMGLLQDISERKRAEDAIRGYVARLEQAMQSTINVVATIGELRDPYTHGHERRVGEIAAAIATEMGLESQQVEGIRIAGYMHDVGKIAVPAEILSKPARLTKAELDLVRDHAQQSYEILKTVPFPWPVADAAWQHHERLDGSGYPRGLKGDQIILEARVLAVADTVEAMSSHRPYRPGLGIEKALSEVERNRDKLYDPAAVDACLRLFREKGYGLPA